MINAVFWGPAQGAPPFDFETFHRKFLNVIRRSSRRGSPRASSAPRTPRT